MSPHFARERRHTMIGKKISHYEILKKLGEGGIGVAYKARDTRFDRIVALNFLALHVLGGGERQTRVVREAKSAAALNHPNICTIYEIDKTEGRTFVAIECVEGQGQEGRKEARWPPSLRQNKTPLPSGNRVQNGLVAGGRFAPSGCAAGPDRLGLRASRARIAPNAQNRPGTNVAKLPHMTPLTCAPSSTIL